MVNPLYTIASSNTFATDAPFAVKTAAIQQPATVATLTTDRVTISARALAHTQLVPGPSLAKAAAVPQPAAVIAPPIDRVTIPAGVQAHNLLIQGQSIAQIAAALGATTTTIDRYLGIVSQAAGATVLALAATS